MLFLEFNCVCGRIRVTISEVSQKGKLTLEFHSYVISLAIFLFATLVVVGSAYLLLRGLAGRKEAAPKPVRIKV